MSEAYKITEILGPFMRLDSRGQTEAYYTVKGQTAGGVNFREDVAEGDMDAATLRPLLDEKARKLDSVKSL